MSQLFVKMLNNKVLLKKIELKMPSAGFSVFNHESKFEVGEVISTDDSFSFEIDLKNNEEQGILQKKKINLLKGERVAYLRKSEILSYNEDNINYVLVESNSVLGVIDPSYNTKE